MMKRENRGQFSKPFKLQHTKKPTKQQSETTKTEYVGHSVASELTTVRNIRRARCVSVAVSMKIQIVNKNMYMKVDKASSGTGAAAALADFVYYLIA